MILSLNRIWSLTKQAATGWVEDDASSMGAALAYYTIFSLAPLLVIVIAVVGLIFGDEVARQAVFSQLVHMVGPSGAEAVEALLKSARNSNDAIFSLIVSLMTLFVGATTVFAELQNDLNRIWKVKDHKNAGVWHFLRTRLLSFGIVVGIGFLLIVSLVISAGIAAFGEFWGGWFRETAWLFQGLNLVVSFVIITALFAMIYKILPSVNIAWKDVAIGAAVTSLFFTIGKFLIGLYIEKTHWLHALERPAR